MSTDAPADVGSVTAEDASASTAASDERRLAVGAVQVLVVLAVPVAGVAALVAGSAGAISALIGLSFVFVLFGASAALLVWIAARRSNAAIGLLVLGAVVRLPLYFVALRLLERVSWIHGHSLAAATGLAVAVTLGYELRLMAKMPRLFWVDAAASQPSAATPDTRSQTP